jgi:hypothetical protein
MTAKMKRSNALEHLHEQIGIYEWEWEDDDEPEPNKFVDLTNAKLQEIFCTSGVFNHVFDGTDVGEKDFSIVDD